jgi:hypothetical protein
MFHDDQGWGQTKSRYRLWRGVSGAAYVGVRRDDDDSAMGVEFVTSDILGFYFPPEMVWIHLTVDLHTYDVPGCSSYTVREKWNVDLGSHPRLAEGFETQTVRSSYSDFGSSKEQKYFTVMMSFNRNGFVEFRIRQIEQNANGRDGKANSRHHHIMSISLHCCLIQKVRTRARNGLP